MVNLKSTSRLLCMPIIWMGFVQFSFALLSFFVFKDHMAVHFAVPAAAMSFVGIALFSALIKVDMSKTSPRDALLFTTLTWVVIGMLGAIPIVTIANTSFTDAVFESISALTTTGATILSGLDNMPPSFLMYRQFLQWMGGLGIVIFVVAVLPMLNVGGMRLLKAETPGPVKDDKVSPRVASTAHYLWGVYITITALCALAYYACGMSVYDAIAHSFSTVSTGGFSTHDASMGYFNSHLILAVSDIFMLAGAISFALHFRVFSQRKISSYLADEETRVFLGLVLVISLVLGLYLFETGKYVSLPESLSYSLFHVVSFITSTGFGASDFGGWGQAAAFLLIFSGYLGGCAGSTAGGNKIIRNIVTLKIIRLNIRQALYPQGVFSIRYQNRAISPEVRTAVMSFMTIAAGSSLVLTLLMMTTGLDFWSAFSAVAACVNVSGPGFGMVGANFQPVSDLGIWILSSAMILGRLEYFTVFALFSIHFWRA